MLADALPAGLRRALSPYTGIVRSLEECLHSSSDPPLFRAACEVGNGRGLLDAPLEHVSGIGGAGLTRRDAAAAAVGEAIERYSASYIPRERVVLATARELGDAAVAPERFALFSARQYAAAGFPFVPFTADTRVPWIEGSSLPGRRTAWLPAELVLLADPVPDGLGRIGHATSSGTACAPQPEEALVRGLCEVLERDAFMIVWANRLSLPRLDWTADERISALDRTLFAPVGLHYRAIDLSVFTACRRCSAWCVRLQDVPEPSAWAQVPPRLSSGPGGRRCRRRSRLAPRRSSWRCSTIASRQPAAATSCRSRITFATTPMARERLGRLSWTPAPIPPP